MVKKCAAIIVLSLCVAACGDNANATDSDAGAGVDAQTVEDCSGTVQTTSPRRLVTGPCTVVFLDPANACKEYRVEQYEYDSEGREVDYTSMSTGRAGARSSLVALRLHGVSQTASYRHVTFGPSGEVQKVETDWPRAPKYEWELPPSDVVDYEYDNGLRSAARTDDGHLATYNRDTSGRLLDVETVVEATSDWVMTVTYQYDESDRITEIDVAEPGDKPTNGTNYTVAYDTRGRVESIRGRAFEWSGSYRFEYDGDSQRVAVFEYGSGDPGGSRGRAFDFTYRPDGTLATRNERYWDILSDDSRPPDRHWTIDHDAHGNRISAVGTVDGTATGYVTYDYDCWQ